jgi:3-oxoacyl-[acyl-carrier-protein] synthase-3
MALLHFTEVGITGIAAAVPKNTIYNKDYTEHFDPDVVAEIVKKTGIEERRFVPQGMTASDLCFAAAEKLLEDKQVDKKEIDLVVFVSQTPDYRMPATSVILQNRLGLSKDTAAFDINLGCSGFVYGLSVIYSLVMQPHVKKALLLDGETRSKIYHPKDRNTAFLFGDGGVAALIEKDKKFKSSYFNLGSDGARESLIKVNAGGYRNPTSVETLQEKVVDEHGNIRTEEHGYMNGADVFNFVLREIPENLKELYSFSQKDSSDMDYYIFHQANRFMNDYLRKKLKLPKEKVPESISKFGNTSSVSIPLTIVNCLQNKLQGDKEILLCGFGVGMSWGSAILPVQNCFISDLQEI